MANSDFWRDLAASFQSVPGSYEFTATRLYFMELPTTNPIWYYPGAPPEALAEFGVMARRGASILIPPPTGDLTVAWLEALWNEATNGPVRRGIEIIGKDRTGRLTNLRGKIDRVFQASYALCRKFESEALQAEYEQAQRDSPKNWSPFRQQYEAFNRMREIRTESAERIPEEFVRETIARICNIKPEDVTDAQIRFEVAGLLSATRRHIEFIPTLRKEEPSAPPEQKPAPSEPHPTSVPAPTETVAAQIQRLRLECKWSIEQLAAKTGFDERTIRRHLSGKTTPHLRNIGIYEQAFSKAMKREIVINKMP